ncbi:MAG: hypothetical protein HY751_12350 [Nitrospinae bacterium]|nr:hypothetical protein [Nitrospinota bacterium]
MSRLEELQMPAPEAVRDDGSWLPSIGTILESLGVNANAGRDAFIESLPFTPGDITAGAENELLAVVVGDKERVDLPRTIAASSYFANVERRAASGDTPKKRLSELEEFLGDNKQGVWENSWARFPRRLLNNYADMALAQDMLEDKRVPDGPRRSDSDRFLLTESGEQIVRVPISYLLKLALADLIGALRSRMSLPALDMAEKLLGHFSSDNTSPEICSFYVPTLTRENGVGKALARETALRYMFIQLLAQYANERFGLAANGQRVMVYFAPHPPIRQKKLNDLVSDEFYRELYMSPCLSGWDRGEDKHDYMRLCHQTLSRSQLNAVLKLRSAGIITSNLVVLPNVSNISLANNGTHISIGSKRLTAARADKNSGFGRAGEKLVGDLVIKIVEHFLPLFVGTYSAAPYRLAFSDFHPERALGFLSHELDFTHLRMLWRRWKKKARLNVFGLPITPFGPLWLDNLVSSAFGLKGDFVPDFRLIDYLVCLLSTESSPALDGRLDNDRRLKKDLASLGVFDERMSLYLLYKLREFHKAGYFGFEGRHYSVFENIEEDMGAAASLQSLVTALAFKLVAEGAVDHSHIPDNPFMESERRQIFFGSAIGLPTFYVKTGTANRFLTRVLSHANSTRLSGRYQGYMRIHNSEYRRALLSLIAREGAELVEAFGMGEALKSLMEGIDKPWERSAWGRMAKAATGEAGAKAPMRMGAEEFNAAMERYYREGLRRKNMEEGYNLFLDALGKDIAAETAEFAHSVKESVMDEKARLGDIVRLAGLFLAVIHGNGKD